MSQSISALFSNFSRSNRLAGWRRALAGLALGALALGSLGSAFAQEAPPLAILSTIGIVADVAAEVGGACVALTTLMGPGIDPHLYRASAQDVGRFQAAELVLYSGYALEGQLGAVLEGLARRVPTLAVTEAAVPRAELLETTGAYGIDPHVWMDAGLWVRTVPVIAEAVSAQRPDCAPEVSANAARYGAELAALDAWVRTAIATIPPERRVLVTAHDAFAYYGRAYGIAVAGIQGISTEAEVGIADITQTARRLVDNAVPAIFVESTINPRTIHAVIDAAAQQGHTVAIGGQLYADAMGEAGTAEGTYIGMIHANTRAIVTGLGGTVPPLPDALADWAARYDVPMGEPA